MEIFTVLRMAATATGDACCLWCCRGKQCAAVSGGCAAAVNGGSVVSGGHLGTMTLGISGIS